MDCLFCKFVSGELPANKVFEDENCIIIRDIAPEAKNHFLVIPKKHYKLIAEATEADAELLGKILKTVSSLEEKLDLKGGYRLVINQGDDAGQTVPHLHVHLLSGEKMGWDPSGNKAK